MLTERIKTLIMHEKTSKKAINTNCNIVKHYKQQGYKVYPKGLKEGRRDKGIDIIAYKGKEALLIQCKNWERSQVKQEHLRIFLGDCTAYIEQNQKIFAKRSVRRVFVTSCKSGGLWGKKIFGRKRYGV